VRFAAVLPQVELFLYDLKHRDARRHQECTGLSNRLILENLRRLSSCEAPIEIRLPLIPGVNDAAPHLEAVAAFLCALENPTRLRLVPYHALAHSKYEAVGRPDTMSAVPPPDAVAIANAAALLRGAGIDTVEEPPPPGKAPSV